MSNLFFRHGGAFTGTAQFTEKGQAFVVRRRVCGRCGGAGGSSHWAPTGWTCYDCGGEGFRGTETLKLYTAEKLAKLNATAAKRAEKKAAAAAAAKAVVDAEIAARREAFEAAHGALLEKASAFAERSEFVKDVVAKARENAALTEGQEAGLRKAIERFETEAVKKAASGHVGAIGERLTFKVKAERVVSISTQFGALRIATMRDENGNAIVSKGRFIPPTAEWTEEHGWKIADEPFVIKATVKEHGAFRDEKQTIVQRVVELEPAA